MNLDDYQRFAGFVATLGRGPGRSRALTRVEAREAFAMVLRGRADPHQVGAFLMLLRYRGEDADEIAGLVEAARDVCGLDGAALHADLDWPSYGAGRTRGAPWFLLAALALAGSGVRVFMHGTNAFSSGLGVAPALGLLGLSPATSIADAATQLDVANFAYLPISVMAPPVDRLLGLRALFGLRSPVNTVARLLDPARAPAGVDGVFHPAYIDVHLAVAELLQRPALLVLKGGGGEAEHTPAKAATAHLWRHGVGRSETLLPATIAAAEDPTVDTFVAVWQGTATPVRAVATVLATIAMGLLALGHAATADAAASMAIGVWANRPIKTLQFAAGCGRSTRQRRTESMGGTGQEQKPPVA
jgi:anthranilate phosphoribosyltransferase